MSTVQHVPPESAQASTELRLLRENAELRQHVYDEGRRVASLGAEVERQRRTIEMLRARLEGEHQRGWYDAKAAMIAALKAEEQKRMEEVV
jgi:hypothetical protein